MATLTAQEQTKAAQDRLVLIAEKFKLSGVTTKAFFDVTLTPAQLAGYLAVVGPLEDLSDPAVKSLWDEALVKNQEMMAKAGQTPLVS